MLKPFSVLILLAAFTALGVFSSGAASVAFKAESGVLGSNWAVSNSGSPASIAITSNVTGSGATNPTNASRVAAYTVTFPAAGTYNLYARVQVGSGGYSSDSLFYRNGFGTKNPTFSSDWITVNGLASAGFNNSTDVVTDGGSLTRLKANMEFKMRHSSYCLILVRS